MLNLKNIFLTSSILILPVYSLATQTGLNNTISDDTVINSLRNSLTQKPIATKVATTDNKNAPKPKKKPIPHDVELLIRNAKKGDKDAQFAVGNIYQQGVLVDQDLQQAFNFYGLVVFYISIFTRSFFNYFIC